MFSKNFIIYYGDRSTFQGRPEDAPSQNVQAIAWNDPTKGNQDLGRVVMYEWDIYIYSDHVGGWHGTNKYADLLQHLGQGCGPGGVRAVLTGRWVNKEIYQEIMKEARTSELLDKKSANNLVLEDGSE
jgi:hypothetical protein